MVPRDGASEKDARVHPRHARVIAQLRDLARRWGVHPEEVARTVGLIDQSTFERLTARRYGLRAGADSLPTAIDEAQAIEAAKQGWIDISDAQGPAQLRPALPHSPTSRLHLSPSAYASLLAPHQTAIAVAITARLREERPAFSAATREHAPQLVALFCALMVAAIGALPVAYWPIMTANIAMVVSFAVVSALRATAFLPVAYPRVSPLPDAELPRYVVLVPLLRESAVVADLVRHLRALNYPQAKLDIRLLVEADDEETERALRDVYLPPFIRIVRIPVCQPRTKPKALNIGLLGSQAELVTIYDAEDRPAPDQLRRAASQFAASKNDLGCLQARLRVDNADAGVWAALFALEYEVLFGAFLPNLQRFGLPIPLGGTSNHFRRTALEEAGGWDAHNVTEDADLGFRLLRQGWRVEMLDSDTWEEAPHRPGAWMAQRTRWYKGWLQTWVVHMRRPAQLWRDFGPRAFIALQVLMLGMVLSAVAHPFLLILTGLTLAGVVPTPDGLTPMNALNAAILIAGHGVVMVLTWTVARTGPLRRKRLWAFVWPLYMLAHSWAVLRAVYGYLVTPFRWAKTSHGLTAREESVASRAASGITDPPWEPKDLFGRSEAVNGRR